MRRSDLNLKNSLRGAFVIQGTTVQHCVCANLLVMWQLSFMNNRLIIDPINSTFVLAWASAQWPWTLFVFVSITQGGALHYEGACTTTAHSVREYTESRALMFALVRDEVLCRRHIGSLRATRHSQGYPWIHECCTLHSLKDDELYFSKKSATFSLTDRPTNQVGA